jgi:phenylpropionate dioxygenase-like ring-hydroxylating dioxygenase large terminal subunit
MTPPAATAEPLLNWPDTLIDDAAFAAEQERLARVWTFLGQANDVARDGDWFRTTLATRSVFVQRFGDALRGFENRCAHRSFPLRTADKGNGPIRCGFHHWRYDREGRAVEIPLCETLFGKTAGELGAALTPIEIATCGSLIFGRFRQPGGSETLEQFLGDAFPIVEALWRPPANPRVMVREVKANWRLCVQISVEEYHVPAVHYPIWGRSGYLQRDRIGYFRLGSHSVYFIDPDPDGLARMAGACRNGTWRSSDYRVFHIFPGFAVSEFRADREHWYVSAMQYQPVAKDRSLVRYWFRPSPFPPAVDPPWYDRVLDRFNNPLRHRIVAHYARKITGQDVAVCERLQSVAQQIDPAPTIGRLEERIGWFEAAYRRAMHPPASRAGAAPE